MSGDRSAMSRTYRRKSDEVFLAAQASLREGYYRSACNRAWYAVMQLVTAAAYEELLNEHPPNEKPNWAHDRQGHLFRGILSKHKIYKQHIELTKELDVMRKRRNDADYSAPSEIYVSKEEATRSVEAATKVRELLYDLMANKWILSSIEKEQNNR